jgi:3-oxoacyl-(acyl-carrier-protein) synthase
MRAFVTGLGAVCAGADNVRELRSLLAQPKRCFQQPTAFPAKGASAELPVAQVAGFDDQDRSGLPRTHRIALQAAKEAVGDGPLPDAIVVGTTTGGILTTETELEAGTTDPKAYRFHGLETVAQALGDAFSVGGLVITVSTACSSAAVAMSVAQALLRAGLARRVLAGGADSLSRLTFHGFRQLQLVAPDGCKPLDLNRAGMTVGEGAGFLVLESDPKAGRRVFAELLGTGLSCDAYHATSPHPEGAGAVLAMRHALTDAGLVPAAISYVSLHGTGTIDNDAAEARALGRVFGDQMPASSSTKGLTGHTLAAAGGIEAVVSVIAIEENLLPANSGLGAVDPKLGVSPVLDPTRAPVDAVLSNSFGFGGNNACVILAKHTAETGQNRGRNESDQPATGTITTTETTTETAAHFPVPALRVAAVACLTARGGLEETLGALTAGDVVMGLVPDAAFAKAAPAAFVRRLRRLPRLMIGLANTAHAAAGTNAPPEFLAVGTAWGPLAETREFLRKLFESNDQFSSPMDFIGSVNNAPAGQVALLLSAQSPNLTFSSGDRSFEQAVLSASLGIAAGARNALVLAAEAFEAKLSPLLDPAAAKTPCDGGAAFVLVPDDGAAGARVRWLGEAGSETSLSPLLGGIPALADRFDAVALGIPAATVEQAHALVSELAARLPNCPILPYRDCLGQHASVSATATAVVAQAVLAGALRFANTQVALPRRRVLLLQLGRRSTALEVFA